LRWAAPAAAADHVICRRVSERVLHGTSSNCRHAVVRLMAEVPAGYAQRWLN